MWDYLFDPKSQQSPSNKESPCKLIFIPRRHMLYWDSLHCVLAHALREAQLATYYSSSPRLQIRLTWSRTLLLISRAQLSFIGTLLCLFVSWKLSRFYPPSDKSSSLLARQSSSLLIWEDHIVNWGHSSSLCWIATRLTWSTWSMVISLESFLL